MTSRKDDKETEPTPQSDLGIPPGTVLSFLASWIPLPKRIRCPLNRVNYKPSS